MSNKRNQHVVPHDRGWAVKGAGSHRATEVFDKKVDAVERGREIAKNKQTELIIHRRDGVIQTKDSHGHDPFPPKG